MDDVNLLSTLRFARQPDFTTVNGPVTSIVHGGNPVSRQDDLLSLLTCAASLYRQEKVLAMQNVITQVTEKETVHAMGATSTIQRTRAEFTQPSGLVSATATASRLTVVLKRSHHGLFHRNGLPRDSANASSFIMELRILSHPDLRKQAEIVTLLGLYWDCTRHATPEPVMVLEYAEFNLKEFQKKYPTLPLKTKRRLALEVATGINALHNCGIIHGDVKPDNVLIFSREEPHAKIADFGHSILDSGEVRTLLGGTERYAAPEWRTKAKTTVLRMTDVYSYGLVALGILAGFDVPDALLLQLPSTQGLSQQLEAWQNLKESDELGGVILETVIYGDAFNFGHDNGDMSDDPSLLMIGLLDTTIQANPSQRSLERALYHLTGISFTGSQDSAVHVREADLCVPYQALEPISSLVKDQVLCALIEVANTPGDYRQPAACHELGVCYASSFGSISSDSIDPDANTDSALKWMSEAAHHGHVLSARVLPKLYHAYGREIPATTPIHKWLKEAILKGSVSAIEQMKHLDSTAYTNYLQLYRKTYCGNYTKPFDGVNPIMADLPVMSEMLNERADTVLHYAASVGKMDVLRRLSESQCDWNCTNNQGDTALVCATRAGHHQVVPFLVSKGADASITNNVGESALHFLANLNDDSMEETAALLCSAGANIYAQARGSTQAHDLKLTTGGDASLRAVTLNSPKALEVLLDIGIQGQLPLVSGERRTRRALGLHRLIGYAVKLQHIQILYILQSKLPQLFDHRLGQLKFWDNGQLLSLPALCLVGGVSPNPEYGVDLPEKFWRLSNFDAEYLAILWGTLEFLAAHGADYYRQTCGAHRNVLTLAISRGRYDGVKWIMSRPDVDVLRASNIPSATFWHRKTLKGQSPSNLRRREEARSRHYGEGDGNAQDFSDIDSIESSEEDDPLDEELASQPELDMHSGVSGSVPSHRGRWPLIELVDLAIVTDQREILDMLLRYRDGLALTGDAGEPEINILTSGYGSREPTDMIAAARAIDARGYFPPAARQYPVIFGQPRRTHRYTNFETDPVVGSFCYPLLYLNTLAETKSRDVFLAHIILNVQKQLFPEQPIEWAPRHWFFSECFASAAGTLYLAPLLFAVKARWYDLVRILLHHGASPQDGYYSLDKKWKRPALERNTIMSYVLGLTGDVDDMLISLLTIAAEEKVSSILTLQDVEDFLRHSLKQTPRREDADYRDRPRIIPDDGDHKMQRISPVQWVNGQLDWLGHDDWKRAEQDIWQAVHKADRAQAQRLVANGKRSNALLDAVVQQKYFATQTLLEMNFHPNGNMRLFQPRITSTGIDLRPAKDDLYSFFITPLDLVFWTSLVSNDKCTSSGLKLKRQNERIETLLRQHGATRGLEYSMFFQVFIVPLWIVVAYILTTVIVGALMFVFGAGTWGLAFLSWDDLKDRAEKTKSKFPTADLWNFWLGSNIIHEVFMLSIAILVLASKSEGEFAMYWMVVVAVIGVISLFCAAAGAYFAFSMVCVLYPFGGIGMIITFNITLACLGAGIMVGVALYLSAPYRVSKLAESVHGGNKEIALAAMYGPGQISFGTVARTVRMTWKGTRVRARAMWRKIKLRTSGNGSAEASSEEMLLEENDNLEASHPETLTEEERNEESRRAQEREDRRRREEERRREQRRKWNRRGRDLGVGFTDFMKKRVFGTIAYPFAMVIRFGDFIGRQSAIQEERRERRWLRNRNADLVQNTDDGESFGLLERY